MLTFLNNLIIVLMLMLKLALAAAPSTHVLILISGQDNKYHQQLGNNLRDDIVNQSQRLSKDYIIHVRLLHEIFNHPGDWTILTALPHLVSRRANLLHDNTKWIILCEDSTHVTLPALLDYLGRENHTQSFYLGHDMYDHEATIIHHFAYFENPRWFPYPMLRAGIIFTVPLFKRLAALVSDNRHTSVPPHRTEFAIDAAHELASFIMDNVRVENDKRSKDIADGSVDVGEGIGAAVGVGSAMGQRTVDSKDLSSCETGSEERASAGKVILKKASYICPSAGSVSVGPLLIPTGTGTAPETGPQTGLLRNACAMHAQPLDMTKCPPVKREQIYFAIKTYHKFHAVRIPIIEATWGSIATHRKYFSDVADENIPTMKTGVPNTETGHCAKTLAILKLASQDIKHMNRDNIQWLFLTDDDTLLSVAALCGLLGCFDPTALVYLGERYGYRAHADDGFNYITGGGGIALSLPTVELILEHCSCPTASAPDDMILGSCLSALHVKAIHSQRFHQARPNDYPSELLQLETPISFHKFWQLDPTAVYRQWFAQPDLHMLHAEAQSMRQKVRVRSPSSNESHRTSKLIPTHKRERDEEPPHKHIKMPVSMDRSPLAAIEHSKEKHIDL